MHCVQNLKQKSPILEIRVVFNGLRMGGMGKGICGKRHIWKKAYMGKGIYGKRHTLYNEKDILSI